MKRILIFVLVLCGCASKTDQCLNVGFVCDLYCDTNHECRFYESSNDGEKYVEQICALKNDIQCESDIFCIQGSKCVNGLCEENGCIDSCDPDQDCIQIPNSTKIFCVDKN